MRLHLPLCSLLALALPAFGETQRQHDFLMLKAQREKAIAAYAITNTGTEPSAGTPVELPGLWQLPDTTTKTFQTREFKPGRIDGDKLVVAYPDQNLLDHFNLPIRNHQLKGMSRQKRYLTMTWVAK